MTKIEAMIIALFPEANMVPMGTQICPKTATSADFIQALRVRMSCTCIFDFIGAKIGSLKPLKWMSIFPSIGASS